MPCTLRKRRPNHFYITGPTARDIWRFLAHVLGSEYGHDCHDDTTGGTHKS